MEAIYKNYTIKSISTPEGQKYIAVAANGTAMTNGYVNLGALKAHIDFLTMPRPVETPEDAEARHRLNVRKLGRTNLNDLLV
jgi:hypothetical protein